MTEREALKLALEALEKYAHDFGSSDLSVKAMYVVRQALAQPEHEPVAWPCVIAEADFSQNTVTLTMQGTDYKVSASKHWLCATPPQRTWVGLTDEEIIIMSRYDLEYAALIGEVQRKLKEKNT